MPIAQCMLSKTCKMEQGDLIALWSQYSNVPEEHLTINLFHTHEQLGHLYPIMVNLQLPSLWSKDKIFDIQLGLLRALIECFSLQKGDVHIVSTIIESGMVVENGNVLYWD